jgi:4-hydroxybenzoyl-CoA reductase subunit beta
MRLPDFEYVEPRSIEEAALFLRDNGHESMVIAGGTDLLPSMKQGIFRPNYLVNLCSVPLMDRIEFDDGSGLRIGALVRLRTLERDPLIREHYPMIAQAAEAIGSVQLRQMGTVGGNLSLDTRCYYYNQSDFWRSCRPTCIKMGGDTCNAIGGGKKCFAVFSGDLAPALIALGAKIRLVSASGERSLLLKDFYTGDGAKPLERKPGEFLVSVEVPVPQKDAFTTYLKYRIRKSIDFPLASMAAMLMMDRKEQVCRDARVVISAVGTRPEEVTRIHDLLLGKKLERSLIEEAAELAFKAARPVANTASTPTYRKRMIKILVGRTLKRAAESAV